MVLVFAMSFRCSSAGHTEEEGEDLEHLKLKTKQVGDKAAETEQEAKEASESWTEWAKERIAGGLGLKAEEAKEAAKKGYDSTAATAKKSKDKVQEAASGSIYLFENN